MEIVKSMNQIEGLNCKINENKQLVHKIVVLLYCALHLFMTLFHEPWYDEAEAWQIARCASVKDILFTIPHYEGHPPLWHLILAIPAKLNLPYELSLSLISLLFSALVVALFLKYAPFPEGVKVFVPFTYFAFYQYSVIARPYCMMMLAVVLISITWKLKDEKPWRFVLSMAFLCLTSSYGIIIAGGISIVWLLQIISDKKSRFLKDNRTIALIALLVLALLLTAEVMPRHDTSATAGDGFTLVETLYNLLFAFIMMIPESTITRVIEYDQSISYVSSYSITAISSAVILGFVIWCLILYYGKCKKTLLWFVVPYTLFAAFSSVVYFYAHHIGIGLLVFMFWAWITEQSDVEMSDTEIKQVATIISHFLAILSLAVSCYWTVSSCILDVRYDYYPSRSSAKFIKENDLQKLLNEIGIVAEADAPKPSKSKSEKVKKAAQTGSKPSRKVSKNPAEEWQECYDFVKRCLEEGGTLPIGEKSTTMPNGVQTKSWIKQQRIALKESRLPADKVELLRAIGIVGNLMEQNWMRDYECIKA